MGCHVVDTCVLIAANGMADASPVCADACRAALLQALNEMVALDDQWLILNEYFTYAHHSGQPGLGDAFAKRLRDQQFDPKVVRRVALTPDEARVYEQFPDDDELVGFDRSDRPFVAVACGAGPGTRLITALDSDYRIYREPIQRHLTLVVPDDCWPSA